MSQGIIMVSETGPAGSAHRKHTYTALYGLVTLRAHYSGLLRLVTDSHNASCLAALAAQLDVDVVALPHRNDFIYSAVLNMLQHCGDADEWLAVDPYTVFFKDPSPAFAHINPQKPIALAPAQKDMVAYAHMKKAKTNRIDRAKFEGRSNARFAEGSVRLFAFRPADVVDLFADWKHSFTISRSFEKHYHMSESLNAADHDDLISLLPHHFSRKVLHLKPQLLALLDLDEQHPLPQLPADTVSLWAHSAMLHGYWQATSTVAQREQVQAILNA